MKKWMYVLLLLFPQATLAQQFEIRGQISDSSGQPLPDASVLLLDPADSSMAAFGLSGRDGTFRFRGIKRMPYLLELSFLGYRTYSRLLDPPQKGPLDLGVIRLEPSSETLEGVTVQGSAQPIRISKDTVEFNTAAFKTRPNASVEELLEKLPGVEVDEDGTIRAQGEEVKQVRVDGKEFFGKDPKIASRNIPAEAIEKVQLYDKRSDKAEFTGIDDGQEEKTINLQLKEGYRKSTFGTLSLGGGSEERFKGNASLHHFNEGQQLSFLGMANNTNEQGFSIGDYLDFTGNSRQAGGRGQAPRIVIREATPGQTQGGAPPLNLGQQVSGLMTNGAGGINFSGDLGEALELKGNYFLNYLDHETERTMERVNFLPAGNYDYLQDGLQENTHTGHRASAVLDFVPDSANNFKLNTSFGHTHTDMSAWNQSSTSQAGGAPGSSSIQQNFSTGESLNFNADLLYRHRFGESGRNLAATLLLGVGENEREEELQSENEFPGSQRPAERIRQDNSQLTSSRNYGAGFSYTEPLGGSNYLEANFEFREQRNELDREVWDIESGTPVYNFDLSNQYESAYRYQREGINFQRNAGALQLTAGLNFLQSRLEGELLLRDTSISRSYQSVLPALQLRYDLEGNRHVELDYRTNLREPSIEQLQPVTDNSDPLNIYTGNPALQPSYMHQLRLNFMSFNPSSMIHFLSFLNFNYIQDAISYSQTVDEQLVRTTQPVNAGDWVEMRGHASFGFPLSGISSRLGLMANLSRKEGNTFLNGAENETVQHELSGEFRYSYQSGQVLDLMLRGNLSRQGNAYDSGEDQTFFNQRYSLEAGLSFLRHYRLGVDFSYLNYYSTPGDFREEIPLLDLSLSRYLLEGKRGELSLSVDNLLNEDLGVSQQAGVDYLERSVTESLGRYFMLSFTYALNKPLAPQRRGRGPEIRMQR